MRAGRVLLPFQHRTISRLKGRAVELELITAARLKELFAQAEEIRKVAAETREEADPWRDDIPAGLP